MAEKQKRKRVMVDVTHLQDDIDSYWELAGIPEDVWTLMPMPQKLIVLAQRGIEAAQSALEESKEDK